jgi:mevalonate kinase
VEERASFGPGKVIVLGEHGVVYGYSALAGPIPMGIHAYGRPAPATALVVPTGLNAHQKDTLHRAFQRAAVAAGWPKLSVRLSSNLPVSMGLGSSGALSVAISRLLLAASGKKPSLKAVEALAFEMEKEFHGTPSGVDHTTSSRGTLVLFRQGRGVEVRVPKPIHVVVAMVGPRSATKVIVAGLRQRQEQWPVRYRRLFREIGTLVRDGAAAARRGDLEGLGDVMNLNHGFLNALGLSSPPLEDMVYRLRAMGALGAKLTGAGGDGGAVIGLFVDAPRAVKRLRKQGIECFASQIAGPRSL